MVVDGSERVAHKGFLRLTKVKAAFGPPLELPGADVPRPQRAQVVAERLTAALQQLLDSTQERP
jgi:hypothetical protein